MEKIYIDLKTGKTVIVGGPEYCKPYADKEKEANYQRIKKSMDMKIWGDIDGTAEEKATFEKFFNKMLEVSGKKLEGKALENAKKLIGKICKHQTEFI
jgi:hypothetical protein